MLPSTISGGLRGRTHGQKCQAEDRLEGRAFLAGRQDWSLEVSLGCGKVVYTDESQHRRPWSRATGCFTATKKSASQPLCIIWAKLSKTETRNPHWTYTSTCFLYLSFDSYLLKCKSTLEVKLWKQMLMSSAEPEASAAALGPVGYTVPSLEG